MDERRGVDRFHEVMVEPGALGLIATNTIAQGDTRATGLLALVARGWQIFDATDSMPWPGAAAVVVSTVHAAHGSPTGRVPHQLGGRAAPVINSRLRPRPERGDPALLASNAGSSYVGSYVLGMGFTLTPEDREVLVARNPQNGQRIFLPCTSPLALNFFWHSGQVMIGFSAMALPRSVDYCDLSWQGAHGLSMLQEPRTK